MHFLILSLAVVSFVMNPRPPGEIVQTKDVFLDAPQTAWHAVLSRVPLGTGPKNVTMYQWFFSIYTPTGALKYQSPRDGMPFRKVAKGEHWYSASAATIVGAGPLMGPGTQQVVIASHEDTVADCGTSRFDVFFEDAAMRMIMTTVAGQNPCSLDVRLLNYSQRSALQLSGPYYDAKAKPCCPTRPNVTSVLHMMPQGWIEAPAFFRLVTTTP